MVGCWWEGGGMVVGCSGMLVGRWWDSVIGRWWDGEMWWDMVEWWWTGGDMWWDVGGMVVGCGRMVVGWWWDVGITSRHKFRGLYNLFFSPVQVL